MPHYSPYIYTPKKSIEVLKCSEEYIDTQPAFKERISELGWCYQSVGKMIPHTTENFWSGHFFPFVESWEEIQISFNLVMFGLYKQSFMSLRCALELGLLSIYYNINDEGHRTIQDWLKSRDKWEANTPNSKKIWKLLYTNANIKEFDQKTDFKKRFDSLGYLHNFVHTKGFRYSNKLGQFKSNFQTFEENGLLKWFEAYEAITILVTTLHMLKYPIASMEYDWSRKVGIENPYPVLEGFEIDRIKTLLPEKYFDEICVLASKDQQAQELYKHITGLPDMTKDELENQSIELDKFYVEGMGFTEWEKQQLQWLEKGNFATEEETLRRIATIKEWADKNNIL